MGKIILTSILLLAYVSGISQDSLSRSKSIEDSLKVQINTFFYTLKENIEDRVVSQTDVDNFLSYVYVNLPDSFQTANDIIPIWVRKHEGFVTVKEQFYDLIGKKNCKVEFKSWDGYDGEVACTGFKIVVSHEKYDHQIMSIIGSRGEIYCLFSIKSLVDLD